jgi:hypothetical protein
MHTTCRRSLFLAILLGALATLALGACGVADNHALAPAAPPTLVDQTAIPRATGDRGPAASPAGDPTAADSGAAAPTATTNPTASATPEAAEPTAAQYATDDANPFTGGDDLADTGGLSGTTTPTTNHPVALAIADYFDVPAAEVFAEHEEGLGFGEIARAYFLARELAADGDPANDLSAGQILAMHQAGAGWGQIVQTLGLPQSNRGRNLGMIMSRRERGQVGDDTTTAAPRSRPGQDQRGDVTGDKAKNKSNGGNHGNSGKGDSKGKKTR